MTTKISSFGFTLIELLIVMVIMGVLVAIGTTSYVSSSKRGRDNHRKDDLRNIATALESYYSDKGTYPSDDGVGGIKGCGPDDAPTVCQPNSVFKDSKDTIYMILLPKDPVATQKYYYIGSSNSYKLYARLENTQDEGKGVNQAGYSGVANCGGGGAGLCTYAISSSNTTP